MFKIDFIKNDKNKIKYDNKKFNIIYKLLLY